MTFTIAAPRAQKMFNLILFSREGYFAVADGSP
jgi:hypothetical protein